MLRHCTIEELLELRDGDGSAAARSHVGSCDECRVELERLHQRVAALKSLPSFTAPRDRWPIVREAVEMSRRRQRVALGGWAALAAAAAFVLLIGVRSIPGSGPDVLAAQEVESLVEESQELEVLLQEYYRQGRVLNAATAAAIADLEDRIALIDLGIERAQASAVPEDDMADLWRERVALMDQLVTTHVRPVTYVGY
jgi:hypothetical protein